MSTTEQTEETTGSSFFRRLYSGTGAFDIIGKRKRAYIFFGALVLICLVSIIFRGFTYSIEFEGGTQIQLPGVGVHGAISTDQVTRIFTNALGQQPSSVQSVGTGSQESIQIRSESLSNAQVDTVETALFNQLQPLDSTGHPSQQAISDTGVSASWGAQISQRALIGLIVFLVLVSIFLAAYFERWMAIAALVSLVNDVVVAAGVYSLVGFEVTPTTVIGLLTILGFSLYDTVVVFDRVKENTRGLLGMTRRTFAEAANLSVNQTLMRSINTSLIALLPVLGLLIVGVGILGVGTLRDLALIQLVGLLSGSMSSIFLATPLVVDFKMRQPAYQQQAKRVRIRREQAAQRAAARQIDGDATVTAEIRLDETYAAAGVPARHPKATRAKTAGRPSRPAGKKRH